MSTFDPQDPPEHPIHTVLDHLRDHWDDREVRVRTRMGDAAVIDERPVITSSDYQSHDRDRMLVAVPSAPEQGSGYDALDSRSGKLMQNIEGAGMYIDAVAGSHADCEGITADGADANADRVAAALHRHIQRLLSDAQHIPPLHRVSAGTSNLLVDADEPPPVYRSHFRVGYSVRRYPPTDTN